MDRQTNSPFKEGEVFNRTNNNTTDTRAAPPFPPNMSWNAGQQVRSHRRTRSTSGTRSTAGIKVTIDKNAQTQAEANESTKRIRETLGGIPLLGYLKYRSTQPGPPDDLREIANHIAMEDERQRRLREQLSNPSSFSDHDMKYKDKNYESNPSAPPTDHAYLPIESAQQIPRHQDKMTNKKGNKNGVNCPTNFIPGTCSVTDDEGARMFKVSRFFPPVTGNRKFSGRRGHNNDEGTINSLLQCMNSAQHICPITEPEFLNYLIQSVTGDAQIYVTELADMHRQGIINMQDIYDRLTERYFSDLRPNTADIQLRELNENNHHFPNLQEAMINISRLSYLAARDSTDQRNREAFKNRDFVRTMMNILPKEYKPFILGKIAEESGNIKGDMTAEDLTRILEIYKVPLDEWFRKISAKNSGHHARIRRIEESDDPKNQGTTGWDESNEIMSNTAKQEDTQNLGWVLQNNSFQDNDKKTQEEQKMTNSKDDCKLCGNPRHNSKNCPFFPPGKNHVAAYECKICKMGLYHFNKHCPMRDSSKNLQRQDFTQTPRQ